jgi:hypothetical protein
MRITAAQRAQNENRIRAAMDRLLRGEIPPDGNCDIKTLAREADVDRTAFYGQRPYVHLREEFEKRLEHLHQAGTIPDPRTAQITRLKNEISELKGRLARADRTIEDLTDIRTQALARLAAQHEEIIRLREAVAGTGRVTHLPTSRNAATETRRRGV